MHLEDIKENCLKNILSDIDRFEPFFALLENQVSYRVRDKETFKETPSVDWCKCFSFGFDNPPTSHYHFLLHDLGNHFPKLVDKLRRFESGMKELCPKHSGLLHRLIKIVYEEAGQIAKEDRVLRSIVTEVVVMTLAGYDEWSYPNDKHLLEERGVYDNVKEFISEIYSKHRNLIINFIDIRREALTIIKDTKEEILRILHLHKLPGGCKLI